MVPAVYSQLSINLDQWLNCLLLYVGGVLVYNFNKHLQANHRHCLLFLGSR